MSLLNIFKKEEAIEEPAPPKENLVKCPQCGKHVQEKKMKKLGKDRKVCKKCKQLAHMASGANYR